MLEMKWEKRALRKCENKQQKSFCFSIEHLRRKINTATRLDSGATKKPYFLFGLFCLSFQVKCVFFQEELSFCGVFFVIQLALLYET